MNNIINKFLSILSIFGMVLSTITGLAAIPAVALASGPTVITPSNLQNWYFYNDDGDHVVTDSSDHGFVTGPGTPVIGTGSVHLTKTTTDSYGIATAQFAGTALSDITSLSYSTYRASGTSAQVPSLGFDVDSNTTDGLTNYEGRLTYEPYFTQPVNTGSWQTWNTLNDTAGTGTGNWWFSHATLNGSVTSVCTQANPCTWNELKTAYPNAALRNPGQLILRTNGATGETFDGNVDNLTFGTSASTTTYDFEPAPKPVHDMTTHLDYSTIQAAIDACSSSCGDTIKVDTGTYPENVNVNKPVILEGANTGIAGIDGSRVAESEVTSFIVSASNVTIDGFSLTEHVNNQINVAPSPATGVTLSGLLFENNVLENYTSVALTSNNGGDVQIKNNLFANVDSTNGGLESMQLRSNGTPGSCTGSTVSNNTFNKASVDGADANFSCTGSASTDITVANNTSTGTHGSFTAFSGIAGDLNINNNTVTGVTDSSAIYFFGSVTGAVSIENNNVTGGNSSAVSISNGANDGSSSSTGIFTITNNDLSGNLNGISVSSGAFSGSGSVIAHQNNLSGNTNGVKNSDTPIVEAMNNFWGGTNGPTDAISGDNSIPETNLSGTGSVALGAVHYDDWCTTSDCAVATPSVTTDLANGITSTDATLNGTNGPVNATGHSFWVSTSTFVTTSPTIPSGVYSTPDLGPINASTSFSALLSSLTTSGVPSNMPAVTPNTKYYFAAWSEVGGTWYPGEVLNFTTSAVTSTSCDAKVNLIKNGDFEAPVVTNSANWDIFDLATYPTLGWMAAWLHPSGAPAVANVEIQKAGLNGWTSATSATGTQWTELDSDWGGPTSSQGGESASVAISQDIPTIVGDEYTVSFDFSPRPGTSAAENSVEVLAGTNIIKTVGPTAGGINTAWTHYSATFIADSATTTITLRDAGTPSDSLGTLIDNVSANCTHDITPPPAQTATLHATKIVCDNESDLPNWGAGNGGAITSATASTFLSNHKDCHIEPWTFETAPSGTSNPGDSTGVAGAPWTPFTTTWTNCSVEGGTCNFTGTKVVRYGDTAHNIWINKTATSSISCDNGTFTDPDYGTVKECQYGDTTTTVNVPSTASPYVWVREQADANYIPFTGVNTTQDVSAEMYCHTDHLNYDNYDRVDNMSANGDYYCVGFNVPKVTPPTTDTSSVTMCKVDESGHPLPGWQLMLKGKEEGSVDVVPTSGNDFTITGVPAGSHIIVADGEYNYGNGGNYSDAAFSHRQSTESPPIVNTPSAWQGPDNLWARVRNFVANPGALGVSYNGTLTNWGDNFNPAHVYALESNTIATGDMKFSVYDNVYGDNVGKIIVTAYNGYTGVTGTDGCVTFDNVPYGQYNTDEINQSGWTNVSGQGAIGPVTVNQPEQTFTIVNKAPAKVNVQIAKYLDNGDGGIVKATSQLVAGATFPMTGTWHAANLDNGNVTSGTFSLGPTNAYKATTSDMTTGADYSVVENIGTECTANNQDQYILEGYKVGDNENDAMSSNTMSSASLSDITSNKFIIVVNKKCSDESNVDNGSANLSITKTVNDNTVDNGQQITYTITVTNTGDANANDVTVNDSLPHGLNYVSDDGDGSYVSGVWSVGTVSATNGTAVLNIVATVDDSKGGDVITNTASINSEENSSSVDVTVNAPTQKSTQSTTSGGSVQGFAAPAGGQVLGAENTCGIYVQKYLRKGYKNDPDVVKKVQTFLNTYMNAGLTVDGIYGPSTQAAVKAFQLAHKDTILDPWGIKIPTGIFYLTTQTAVNNIMCPTLDLPIPSNLINFSSNTQTPNP